MSGGGQVSADDGPCLALARRCCRLHRPFRSAWLGNRGLPALFYPHSLLCAKLDDNREHTED